ncbi:MAG: hypothetical protein OEL83_03655 [Desulforhopalus sp.]|nr:hypothetical protein [Desulforhopalus sp.]
MGKSTSTTSALAVEMTFAPSLDASGKVMTLKVTRQTPKALSIRRRYTRSSCAQRPKPWKAQFQSFRRTTARRLRRE